MFRLENRGVHEVFVADSEGNSVVELLVGRIPIGTYGDIREQDASFTTRHAHPICSLGERLDHQLLILFSPFPHLHVRADDGADVIDDVLLLLGFIVKGHSTSRQRFYNDSNVDFGATGDTYTKIWEGKFDEFLNEIENHFPRGWYTEGVRTFVQRVHNDIGWLVIGQCERLLQALYQDVIGRLVRAVVMSHINVME